MDDQDAPRGAVAIVGGGPGGLTAAKYLQERGFAPTLFEQSDALGGQWNSRSEHSGIWPGMAANSSRVQTAFSDFSYPPGTPAIPSEGQVCDYLRRYADHFGLNARVRLETRVESVERDPLGEGWRVRSARRGADPVEETFGHVVLASGRYNKPSLPSISGLDSFTGSGGVVHSFDYKGPDPYRGRRVVVVGGSVSALEIASDLAMTGDVRVLAASRRQRYVLPGLVAGVPVGHVVFTRYAGLLGEALPPPAMAEGMKAFVLGASGSPEQYGALPAADDLMAAGLTQSQYFLPLVAEGRITPKPRILEVAGGTVRFSDGSEEDVDTILLGTGYDLHLPFLSEAVKRTLDLDERHADLYDFTFHPDLPGLAFLGLYEQSGPNIPLIELQARWIAYVWSGVRPTPSRETMAAGLASYRARRGKPQALPMHARALLFARSVGVEPDLTRWPDLARALLFGPMTGASFRLSGPDSLPDAPERFTADARAFGAVPSPEFSDEERGRLETLAGLRGDLGLDKVLEQAG